MFMRTCKYLSALFFVFSSLAVQAQSIQGAMETCRAEKNSLKRLVCYDGVARQLNQYNGLQEELTSLKQQANVSAKTLPVPPVQAQLSVARSEPKKSSGGDFGLEHKKQPDYEADKISAIVSKVKKNARKKLLITLDNGQLWQQIGTDVLRVKANDPVYVERGLLGSFFLGKEGVNKRMRVKRVK